MHDESKQEILSVFARVSSTRTEVDCVLISHGQALKDRLGLPQSFEMARAQSG